ncbi:esterase/lipase family protein [Streptomyces sp. NPDC059215]|uniref:esterase/lipase family protein n=1 Tax=Streptomyces sp. NPDC059215 TaxID=3346772 RepID=UPI0036C7583E
MNAATAHRPQSAPENARRNLTQDAVVIIPGIMGSELRDTATGKTVWGLSSVRWLLGAWTNPDGFAALRMTEDELEGKVGRIQPVQLMRHSAWTPYLKGCEPYTRLITGVNACAADPAAVLEFAYDWRLSVTTNGRLLAEAARRHLQTWRAHPAHDRARRARVDERPARLVFVAHSMGGLITQAALDPLNDTDLAADTRAVITLATPFYGAVKAAAILNTGRGAPVPLPHRQLQELCATMPGIHDLLPQYACVLDHNDARRLSPGDVAALGGHPELARVAADAATKRAAISLPGHRAVVGTGQTTWQSLTLSNGIIQPHCHTVRRNSDHSLIRKPDGSPEHFDVMGDGTVHKESAALGSAVTPLPLQHGAAAADRSAVKAVQELLRDDIHLGPPMGGPGCGLDTPDLATVGAPWEIRITGIATPAGVTCEVSSVDGHSSARTARLNLAKRSITARVEIAEPGLYRVTIRTRDKAQVSQLVLVMPPARDVPGGDQ